MVSGTHRGYQLADDSIGLFVNFKMVFQTKDKSEARKFLRRLVDEAPNEFKKDYRFQEHYLHRALE
jgi:hypothetical protein